MIQLLEVRHRGALPPGTPLRWVRRPRPSRTLQVLAALLLSASLLLTACRDEPDALDDAAPADDFIILEAPPADSDPEPSPEPDGPDDTDDDVEADADVSGPDPQTVELACDAVTGLAALDTPGDAEHRGHLELSELLDTLLGWRALLEVTYPDAATTGEVVVARREALVDVIELLEALDPDARSFTDLELTTFGRLYDRASSLIAVEDGVGGWVDLVGEPLVDDPDPLIEAGCDADEVMAVVRRDAADLTGLQWPRGAFATDPNAVPFHDALGIGEASMDPDSTDPRARVCPVPAWSPTTELISLDVDQWGVAATCDDAHGVVVTMSANPSFIRDQLGEDALLRDTVVVAADEQSVAVRHLDKPVWLVAQGPDDIEVPLDVLVAAVQGGG